jgi:choline dehydrogenase-like flavoprotein
VDPQLRVHGIPNVSIASGAVFPTSGSANPTFTIMQLALRAADAITARVS